MPFGSVKLDGFVSVMHVVLLELRPLSREASADQVIPTNGFLGLDKSFVGVPVSSNFADGKVGLVEVGSNAGEEDVQQSWVSFDGFSLVADGSEAG
jgi:hypothetical protein